MLISFLGHALVQIPLRKADAVRQHHMAIVACITWINLQIQAQVCCATVEFPHKPLPPCSLKPGLASSPALIKVVQAVAAHPTGSVHQVDGAPLPLQAPMHCISGQARLWPSDTALPAQQVVGQRGFSLHALVPIETGNH